MTVTKLLPAFIWNHIIAYLTEECMEKFYQVDISMPLILPHIYIKNKFIADCTETRIVWYKSEIDPTADYSSIQLKKKFWKHAINNSLVCRNNVNEIMNHIRYHNEMRKYKSTYMYYKIFLKDTAWTRKPGEVYNFDHKQCGIEIIGIKTPTIKPGCSKYYRYSLELQGIDKLIIRNIHFDLSFVVHNTNLLMMDNCIIGCYQFEGYTSYITAVRQILIVNCKFCTDGYLSIKPHQLFDSDNVANPEKIVIISNRFCGDGYKHIFISTTNSISVALKIDICNNSFEGEPAISNRLTNCDLTITGNTSINKTKIDMIRDTNCTDNTLTVYNKNK